VIGLTLVVIIGLYLPYGLLFTPFRWQPRPGILTDLTILDLRISIGAVPFAVLSIILALYIRHMPIVVPIIYQAWWHGLRAWVQLWSDTQ
jgi:hypothetical protein